jgi:hypothetical protein
MKEKEIGDVCLGLSGEERRIASENLDQYLELAWEIFEDVQALKRNGLTATGSNPTILGKVDSSIN